MKRFVKFLLVFTLIIATFRSTTVLSEATANESTSYDAFWAGIYQIENGPIEMGQIPATEEGFKSLFPNIKTYVLRRQGTFVEWHSFIEEEDALHWKLSNGEEVDYVPAYRAQIYQERHAEAYDKDPCIVKSEGGTGEWVRLDVVGSGISQDSGDVDYKHPGFDVAVFGPNYFSDPLAFLPVTTYAELGKKIAKELGGDCYVFTQECVTVERIAHALENCRVVFFDGHGLSDANFYTRIGTTSYIELRNKTGIDDEYSYPDFNGTVHFVAFNGDKTPSYLVDGTVIADKMRLGAYTNRPFFWFSSCYSMLTGGLCTPLRDKGVEVIYGYTNAVTSEYDWNCASAFWGKMLEDPENVTVKEAGNYMWETIGKKPDCSVWDVTKWAYPRFVSSEAYDRYQFIPYLNYEWNKDLASKWTLKDPAVWDLTDYYVYSGMVSNPIDPYAGRDSEPVVYAKYVCNRANCPYHEDQYYAEGVQIDTSSIVESSKDVYGSYTKTFTATYYDETRNEYHTELVTQEYSHGGHGYGFETTGGNLTEKDGITSGETIKLTCKECNHSFEIPADNVERCVEDTDEYEVCVKDPNGMEHRWIVNVNDHEKSRDAAVIISDADGTASIYKPENATDCSNPKWEYVRFEWENDGERAYAIYRCADEQLKDFPSGKHQHAEIQATVKKVGMQCQAFIGENNSLGVEPRQESLDIPAGHSHNSGGPSMHDYYFDHIEWRKMDANTTIYSSEDITEMWRNQYEGILAFAIYRCRYCRNYDPGIVLNKNTGGCYCQQMLKVNKSGNSYYCEYPAGNSLDGYSHKSTLTGGISTGHKHNYVFMGFDVEEPVNDKCTSAPTAVAKYYCANGCTQTSTDPATYGMITPETISVNVEPYKPVSIDPMGTVKTSFLVSISAEKSLDHQRHSLITNEYTLKHGAGNTTSYKWFDSAGNISAVAVVQCDTCNEKVEVNATVKGNFINGEHKYTASTNLNSFTETKTYNHAYKYDVEPEWTFDEYNNATAVFPCKYGGCPGHTVEARTTQVGTGAFCHMYEASVTVQDANKEDHTYRLTKLFPYSPHDWQTTFTWYTNARGEPEAIVSYHCAGEAYCHYPSGTDVDTRTNRIFGEDGEKCHYYEALVRLQGEDYSTGPVYFPDQHAYELDGFVYSDWDYIENRVLGARAVYVCMGEDCSSEKLASGVICNRGVDAEGNEANCHTFCFTIPSRYSVNGNQFDESETVIIPEAHDWEYIGFNWPTGGPKVYYRCTSDHCDHFMQGFSVDMERLECHTYQVSISEEAAPDDTAHEYIYHNPYTPHSWVFDGYTWDKEAPSGIYAAFHCAGKEICYQDSYKYLDVTLTHRDGSPLTQGETLVSGTKYWVELNNSPDEDPHKELVVYTLGSGSQAGNGNWVHFDPLPRDKIGPDLPIVIKPGDRRRVDLDPILIPVRP